MQCTDFKCFPLLLVQWVLALLCAPLPASDCSDRPALDFSSEFEERVLENFFMKLVHSTTAGYALYGEKPVYFNSYCNESLAWPGTNAHRDIVEVREVMDIYNNFFNHEAEHLLYVPPQPHEAGGVEILLINKKALVNVVHTNLALFQSRFGINFDAKQLLTTIYTQKTISALFKGCPALLGIMLGYGTKNSLLYERAAFLKKILYPWSPLYKRQIKTKASGSQAMPKPHWGYRSLEEEMEAYARELAEPGTTIATGAKIPFSYMQGTEETANLLRMYDCAELEIHKKTDPHKLPREVLQKLNYTPRQAPPDPTNALDNLPKKLAKVLAERYTDGEFWPNRESFLSHFMAGVKKAEQMGSSLACLVCKKMK